MTTKPGNTYQVEVKLRPDYSDAEGEAALGLLRSLGVNTAREVRAIVLFHIMSCRWRDRFAPIGLPWHAENQAFRVTLFQEIHGSTNTSKFAGDRTLQDDCGVHARRQGIV